MSRKMFTLISILVVLSMALAACGQTAVTEPPVAETEVVVTEAPEATEAPEGPTARHGGWLDEIDYSIVDAESVITQINAGAVDMFSYGLASDKLAEIKDSGLCYTQSYGTYYGFMFNPAAFTDTTKLNPFANLKMREAMNWAIDRDYLNQEIFAGGALPKYTALTTQLVDYTGVIDTVRGLEAYYAYNLDKAQEVVDTEMTAMGATKGAGGKWEFNGQPITLIFLIRNDGDGTRLPQGEYFAQQLETLGFTVDRQAKTSSELSVLWIESDPKEGLWNLYTAGWGSNGLSRDEKTAFQEMYLPSSPQGIPLFTQNQSTPEYIEVGEALANGEFATLEERHELITKALPLSLQDSLQVWTVDLQTYTPFNCNLQVSADVGAGVETTKMGPFNLRIKGQEGGQVKNASTDTIFTDPWNPVNGANWVTSTFVQNALASGAFMPDPYTGLSHPLRAESAEVVVQTGLPVVTNLDWVTLSTADKIDVPPEAWSDWDATTQKFITTGEKFPDGTTAKVKVTIHYPADMFETVKWHDGSNLSVADFVMSWIMVFDEAKTESAIYDEDVAPNIEALLSHFKGIQLVSTDPLVITFYEDNFYADAELDASSLPVINSGNFPWPLYTTGEAPWHTVAIGDMAVAADELAWGTGRADRNEVEWASFIGGPSLEILSKYLDQAITEKTIPYEPTLGEYITADEAAARYEALKTWYTDRGHFWVGTGPYYLDNVDLNAGSAVVKNNTEYIDLADRWSAFGEAPLAEAVMDGPSQVKIGEEAVFNVTLTRKGSEDPYPSADIKEVKFLLYDDKGETVYVGAGESAGEGLFTLTVPGDVTSKLVAGSGRIEAAGILVPVAIPAFTSLDYVVVP